MICGVQFGLVSASRSSSSCTARPRMSLSPSSLTLPSTGSKTPSISEAWQKWRRGEGRVRPMVLSPSGHKWRRGGGMVRPMVLSPSGHKWRRVRPMVFSPSGHKGLYSNLQALPKQAGLPNTLTCEATGGTRTWDFWVRFITTWPQGYTSSELEFSASRVPRKLRASVLTRVRSSHLWKRGSGEEEANLLAPLAELFFSASLPGFTDKCALSSLTTSKTRQLILTCRTCP